MSGVVLKPWNLYLKITCTSSFLSVFHYRKWPGIPKTIGETGLNLAKQFDGFLPAHSWRSTMIFQHVHVHQCKQYGYGLWTRESPPAKTALKGTKYLHFRYLKS